MSSSLIGNGCLFCFFNFHLSIFNFDKISDAIAGVSSMISNVAASMEAAISSLSKALAGIAHSIVSLAKSVATFSAAMLLSIAQMEKFMASVLGEIDLGILVAEIGQSVARIENRHRTLKELVNNPTALDNATLDKLADACLDFNEGAGFDTSLLHDAMVGTGAILPGVKPIMQVYRQKNWHIPKLAKVWAYFFMIQTHGYSQLMWANLHNSYRGRTSTQQFLHDVNRTNFTQAARMNTQWLEHGAPHLWSCYWDGGLQCPEFVECPPSPPAHVGYDPNWGRACNALVAGNERAVLPSVASVAKSFLRAPSSNYTLALLRDPLRGNCSLGVIDCTGAMPLGPLPMTDGTAAGSCFEGAYLWLNATGIWVEVGSAVAARVGSVSPGANAAFLGLGDDGSLGVFDSNASVLAQVSPAVPSPPAGPCDTDFTAKVSAVASFKNCSLLDDAENGVAWHRLGDYAMTPNMTASRCVAHCQANYSYVQASPHLDGTCWCAVRSSAPPTSSTPRASLLECYPCPGAPIAACANGTSVAAYEWPLAPPLPPAPPPLPTGGTKRWSFVTGDDVDSSPALSPDGSMLYVGSRDNHLYAVDAASGKKKWSFATKQAVVSGPAVSSDGSTVYVGSLDSSLYAIDAASGKQKWSLATGGRILSNPALSSDGSTVYVGSFDDNLYAVDAASGNRKWSFATEDDVASDPALSPDGSTVYVGSEDGNWYAIDAASGKKKWSFLTCCSIEQGVAVSPDGSTVYMGSDSGLYAVDAASGNKKWSFANGCGRHSPALSSDGSTLYVGGGWHSLTPNNMYAVDAARGYQIWSFTTTDASAVRSSPALSPDGSTVYVGSEDGNLYAVDAASGKQKWSFPVSSIEWSKPAVSPDGSTVYVGAEKWWGVGVLHAVWTGDAS